MTFLENTETEITLLQ